MLKVSVNYRLAASGLYVFKNVSSPSVSLRFLHVSNKVQNVNKDNDDDNTSRDQQDDRKEKSQNSFSDQVFKLAMNYEKFGEKKNVHKDVLKNSDLKFDVEDPPLVLQDVSKTKKPPKRSEIIILNPFESRGGKRKKSSHGSNGNSFEKPMLNLYDFAKHKDTLLVFKTKVPYTQLIKSIDTMKPLQIETSPKRFDQLCDDLKNAYTLPQLQDYLVEYYGYKRNKVKKFVKSKLIDEILLNCWKLIKSDKINETEDLIMEETISLTPRDLFLILSDNGILLFHWSRLGAKIAVSTTEQKLIIRAPRPTLRYIQLSLNKILTTKIKSSTLDLTEITKIFQKSMKEIPFHDLQTISNVYFGKSQNDNETYVLSALGNDRISLVKRLIALSLDSHEFSSREILINGLEENNYQNTELMKFKVVAELSLPWIYKNKEWFRYKNPVSKVKELSYQEIFEHDIDYENIEADITELMKENLKLEQSQDIEDVVYGDSTTNDNFESNSSIGLNDFHHSASTEKETLETDQQKPLTTTSISKDGKKDNISTTSISSIDQFQIDKDSLFDRLIKIQPNFSKMAKDKYSVPMFTTTYGQLLLDNSGNHYFNNHLPFMKKFIEKLPLFNPVTNDEIVAGTREFFLNDQYSYFHQIKLIPNIYDNVANLQKFPNIEFWFETDNKYRPNFQSLRILTTEAEKSLYLSLPSRNSDLNISSAILGEFETNFNNNEDWLSDQPGIKDFLKNALVKDRGSVGIHDFPSKVNISIGDEKVSYLLVEHLFRRQLEVKFNNQLLQFSIIDGGEYSGRKLEANLIGNYNNDEMTREKFDKFIDDSLDMVDQF
ncbi:hypothetical protein PACTADRAFT_50479 [Pachysolen tannophilus NRRL Y-2460]|uniref:Uncharacterized protein n=1 Tax=Pachysolen tannophilus NRRL Y-2460 TaxID=669874 RepID=A0A1E4TS91_PACTA|nr:hypothetical protein PACTADRAFT_50479 [Pachysolen tannophilus NRRL Y-2460]